MEPSNLSPEVNALLDAAVWVLTDAVDRGEVYVDKEAVVTDENYPADDQGNLWYHDWWALRVAVQGVQTIIRSKSQTES